MPLTISRSTEQKLLKQAELQGVSPNDLADSIISDALDWSLEDDPGAVEALREAYAAEAAGRVRPFSEYVAEQKAQYPKPRK